MFSYLWDCMELSFHVAVGTFLWFFVILAIIVVFGAIGGVILSGMKKPPKPEAHEEDAPIEPEWEVIDGGKDEEV